MVGSLTRFWSRQKRHSPPHIHHLVKKMVTASCAARRTPSGTRTHNACTHNARRRQRNVSPRASQGSDSVPGIVPVDGELWARVQKQCEKDGVDSHKLVESLLSNWVKERDGFAEKTGTFAAAGQLERIFGRDEIAQLESALARAGEAANVRESSQTHPFLLTFSRRLTISMHAHTDGNNRRQHERRTWRRFRCSTTASPRR